jgi:zinc finger protein
MKLEEGGLDGLYSTVEGLIRRMHERLASTNPFGTGDSAVKQHRDNDGGAFSEMSPRHVKYVEFMDRLKSMADGKFLPFTLIIDDPLSNSFIGPIASVATALALQAEKEGNKVCYGNYTDSSISIEEYTRSFEQNEMLGLNDIRVENYTSCGGRKSESHGTDVPADLPDRLKKLEPRGPDHYQCGS